MKIVSSLAFAYALNAVWEVSPLVLAAEATTRMLRGMRAAVTHRYLGRLRLPGNNAPSRLFPKAVEWLIRLL